MNYTTYHKLQKPLGTEKYNIEVQNANADIIDSALNRLTQKATSEADGLLSKEDKVRYDDAKLHAESVHAPSDAERNTIVKIKQNDIVLDPDNSRTINLHIPTKVSELLNDSNYITSTENTGGIFYSDSEPTTLIDDLTWIGD